MPHYERRYTPKLTLTSVLKFRVDAKFAVDCNLATRAFSEVKSKCFVDETFGTSTSDVNVRFETYR
jgi:hypothetical protein